MSLTNRKSYRLGIIASRGFDHPDFLDDKFGTHLDQIIHLYTNGVNRMVIDWATTNGVPYTVYPATRQNTIIWSNNRVLDNSDKVYILTTPDSSGSKLAIEECKKRNLPFDTVEYEALAPLLDKLGKATEIVGAATPETSVENLLAALRKVL